MAFFEINLCYFWNSVDFGIKKPKLFFVFDILCHTLFLIIWQNIIQKTLILFTKFPSILRNKFSSFGNFFKNNMRVFKIRSKLFNPNIIFIFFIVILHIDSLLTPTKRYQSFHNLWIYAFVERSQKLFDIYRCILNECLDLLCYTDILLRNTIAFCLLTKGKWTSITLVFDSIENAVRYSLVISSQAMRECRLPATCAKVFAWEPRNQSIFFEHLSPLVSPIHEFCIHGICWLPPFPLSVLEPQLLFLSEVMKVDTSFWLAYIYNL